MKEFKIAVALVFVAASPTALADFDADKLEDANDNCIEVPNPLQIDADADGYGNVCDPDLNNDGIVNFADLAIMKSLFLTSDPVADLNSDGTVNFGDLAILSDMFLLPPGPSGIAP